MNKSISNTSRDKSIYRIINLDVEQSCEILSINHPMKILPKITFTLGNELGEGLLEIGDPTSIDAVDIDGHPAAEINHIKALQIISFHKLKQFKPQPSASDSQASINSNSYDGAKKTSFCILPVNGVLTIDRPTDVREVNFKILTGKSRNDFKLGSSTDRLKKTVPKARLSCKRLYFWLAGLTIMAVVFAISLRQLVRDKSEGTKEQISLENPLSEALLPANQSSTNDIFHIESLPSEKEASIAVDSSAVNVEEKIEVGIEQNSSTTLEPKTSLPKLRYSRLDSNIVSKKQKEIQSYRLEANFNPESAMENLKRLINEFSGTIVERDARSALNEVRRIHGI